MNLNRTALLLLRVAGITLFIFALYSLDFLNLSLASPVQTAPGIVLLVAFIHACILSYPIARSRWNGWRLVGTMFGLYYGVMYLMTVTEAVYLPEILPPPVVLSLMVNGAITAAAVSVFAVWIHGRMSGDSKEEEPNPRLKMPWTQWIWKLALSAVSYVFLYILFGVLVFLPLAGALDPKGLAEASALSLPDWIIPFQAVRGLLWAILSLPVIRMMRGAWWEAGLAVALVFAGVMSANQLLALDMSTGMQIAHMVEIFGENFALGWIAAWLFYRKHGSRGQVFQQAPV